MGNYYNYSNDVGKKERRRIIIVTVVAAVIILALLASIIVVATKNSAKKTEVVGTENSSFEIEEGKSEKTESEVKNENKTEEKEPEVKNEDKTEKKDEKADGAKSSLTTELSGETKKSETPEAISSTGPEDSFGLAIILGLMTTGVMTLLMQKSKKSE